jgi:hypothetical protein
LGAAEIIERANVGHVSGVSAQYPERSVLHDECVPLSQENGSRWVPTRVALS